MILATFTLIHVLISLAGIATGAVVVGGWLGGRSSSRWTTWFFATTLATSVTGFFFPYHGFTPAYTIGALSIVTLAVAYYAGKASGTHQIPNANARPYDHGVPISAPKWRKAYIVAALFALYLNFFVLVVQLFRKVPALRVLAPTQSELPFAIAQGVALFLFVGIGVGSIIRCRSGSEFSFKE